MLSRSKATLASALILAVSGVAVVPQPSGAQSGSPGPATEDVGPTWVTGNFQSVDGSCSRAGSSSDGGVTRSSYECVYIATSSDPRLSGDMSRPWIEDTYQTDDGAISVGTEAAYLQNEGGGWACTSVYLSKNEELLTEYTFTCIGDGGYQGLTAVLVADPTVEVGEDFVGLIFGGDVPPVPEAPAAEGGA
jgi:hypothetical protein